MTASERQTPVPGGVLPMAVDLAPSEATVELRPPSAGELPARMRPLWREARELPGIRVLVTSHDGEPRLVRLTVQGATPEWSAQWVRWSFAVRRPPEFEGGRAVAAHDSVSEDAKALTLLVMPGERREARIEFTAALDGLTETGSYPFRVHVSDVEDGSAATAPGVLHLRHPQSDLLSRLPSMYAEDLANLEESSGGRAEPAFFTRFLLGFEDAARPMADTLDSLHLYFGAFDTAPDFLPWLSTWVGLVLDENWPEMKKRRLIQEAVELYKWRGTRRGLARYLEIYTGVRPRIDDQPVQGMRLGPDTLLGRDTVLGDVMPHTFVVTCAVPDTAQVKLQTILDIIDAQKPAHTTYTARIVGRTGTDQGDAPNAA